MIWIVSKSIIRGSKATGFRFPGEQGRSRFGLRKAGEGPALSRGQGRQRSVVFGLYVLGGVENLRDPATGPTLVS